MAEYITIMIINNKTAGEYMQGVWHEMRLTSLQPKYRKNWRTVSTHPTISPYIRLLTLPFTVIGSDFGAFRVEW